MIQTFSYPATKAEMIEKATKMAKADGVSFSEFLISLVEEEVRKKAEGSENPIGVLYNLHNKPNKLCQSDLREWLPQKQAILMAKKQPLTPEEWRHLGDTFHIIATKKRTGYL